MAGEPIEAVKLCLKSLVAELKGDPQALETVWLSVITFDSLARQIIPLTDLRVVEMPKRFYANGVTSLGAALRMLSSVMKTEVQQATMSQKGDWKPLVFLFTDGEPTDDWKEVAQSLKNDNKVDVIACAAGASAHTSQLQMLTDKVLILNSVSARDLMQYFSWVSVSIQSTVDSYKSR